MPKTRPGADSPGDRGSRRLHERTAENRARSRTSTIYRGFEILYHPDSWEWSFIQGLGGKRLYFGAQLSARREIDRVLESTGKA